MLAWAELEHASGVAAMTLSVLQTFVPNEATGGLGCSNGLPVLRTPTRPVPSQAESWLRKLVA